MIRWHRTIVGLMFGAILWLAFVLAFSTRPHECSGTLSMSRCFDVGEMGWGRMSVHMEGSTSSWRLQVVSWWRLAASVGIAIATAITAVWGTIAGAKCVTLIDRCDQCGHARRAAVCQECGWHFDCSILAFARDGAWLWTLFVGAGGVISCLALSVIVSSSSRVMLLLLQGSGQHVNELLSWRGWRLLFPLCAWVWLCAVWVCRWRWQLWRGRIGWTR